nr:hypothetical protein [Rhodococcus sp. 06-235-1A]
MGSFDRGLLSIEQVPRIHGKRHAGRGECDSSGTAFEKPNPDHLFESIDCLGEWGLAHGQPFCGSAKVLFLREYEKLLEKPWRDIHMSKRIKTAGIDI